MSSKCRKSEKKEKLIFGKLVKNEGGDVHLVPIKMYKFGGHIVSQLKRYKTVAPADEPVEEVVVESLGPFTDVVPDTRIPFATTEEFSKRSPEPANVVVDSLSPFTEKFSFTRKTHEISAYFSKKNSKPDNVIQEKSKYLNVPTSLKLKPTHELVEELVSETEDYDAEDEIENDPDYEPEEYSKAEDTSKDCQIKTEDDFIFDEETNKYKCKICHRSMKTKLATKKHMKLTCKEKVVVDISESEFDKETNKFTCKDCGKIFKSLQTISAHKKNICNKAPKHECMFCDYKGRNPTVVRVHIGKTHGKWAQLNRNGTWSYL